MFDVPGAKEGGGGTKLILRTVVSPEIITNLTFVAVRYGPLQDSVVLLFLPLQLQLQGLFLLLNLLQLSFEFEFLSVDVVHPLDQRVLVLEVDLGQVNAMVRGGRTLLAALWACRVAGEGRKNFRITIGWNLGRRRNKQREVKISSHQVIHLAKQLS